MRYIKKDFPKVVQLKKKAQAAEEKLRYIVLNIDPDTEREYRREVISATRNAVSSINQAVKSFCKEELPSGFREGQKASDGGKEDLSVSRQQAAAILKAQGFRYSEKAYRYDRYIEIHTATQKAGESFISRVNERLDKLSKTGDDSVYAAKQAIEKELEESGLLTVEYANGARQPISAYATMAARSARIESQNIGGIGRALEHGTDIVKCEGMYPTCPTCRKFIGKWFSISGKDKRFPALFGSSGPLKRKYATIHPNCRCEFLPVYLDFETDEEIKKKAAESKTVKKQSKTEAELYAAWQGQHRREREEETLFRNLNTVYGENMPYKTLAGFRRAYRGNPDIAKIDAIKRKKVIEYDSIPLQDIKKNNKIISIPCEKYKEPADENEIISLVAGGDLTKGSCSSAAFAYIGNKSGYKVRDFRGGDSRDFFSKFSNIKNISDLDGAISISKKGENQIKTTVNLLNSLNYGTEYYLSAGGHAAIVKRFSDHFEYLELQSEKNNGWFPLTNKTLKDRFGCKQKITVYGFVLSSESIAIQIDSLYNNPKFIKLLEYINTLEGDERKGANGYAK